MLSKRKTKGNAKRCSPYNIFSKVNYESFKRAFPLKKSQDVRVILRQVWKKLTPVQKNEYYPETIENKIPPRKRAKSKRTYQKPVPTTTVVTRSSRLRESSSIASSDVISSEENLAQPETGIPKTAVVAEKANEESDHLVASCENKPKRKCGTDFRSKAQNVAEKSTKGSCHCLGSSEIIPVPNEVNSYEVLPSGGPSISRDVTLENAGNEVSSNGALIDINLCMEYLDNFYYTMRHIVFPGLLGSCVIPWFKVQEVDENNNVLLADGPMFKLFREITNALKIRYTIAKYPRQIYGLKMPDGKWTGMIGQLMKNESDIVISPIAANYQRLEAIIHTNEVHMTHLCVVSKANDPTATNVTALLTVFDKEIWLALLICMVIMVFVSSWSVKTDKMGSVKIVKADSKSITEILSQYIATFLFEATPKEPGSSRNRFLFGIWWLSILVLMNAFCGHIRASMMILNESDNIEGIADLIKTMHKIHPYIIKGTSYESYFKFAVSSDNREIWKAVMEFDGMKTFKDFFSFETFSELSDKKCAMISELSLTKYHIGRHCSRLGSTKIHFGNEIIFPHLFTYAFRKGYEDKRFVREFNKRIRWAIEGSLIEKWLEDESKGAYQRCTTKNIMVTERPLRFEETNGVFLAVFLMQIMCFLTLIAELIIAKVTND